MRGIYRQCAFTLIELLVVLAIIATLLSIVVPRYFGTVTKAKESTLLENLYITRNAIDKFFYDNGRYPDALNELVNKRYLRDLPVDPITDSENTWVLVPPADPTKGKVFNVHSGADGLGLNGKPYAEW
jgi:general secretion pathway protein G